MQAELNSRRFCHSPLFSVISFALKLKLSGSFFNPEQISTAISLIHLLGQISKRESSWEIKGGRRVRLKNLPLFVSRCVEHVGASHLTTLQASTASYRGRLNF
jgi:hypothetical protein